MPRREVCVVGASGFIGSAVCRALYDTGAEVRRVTAPRLGAVARRELAGYAAAHPEVVDAVGSQFKGAAAVVNAAGIASATFGEEEMLLGANAAVPAVLTAACALAGVGRFVHVSSAAVQGSAPRLDSSELRQPFSAYSWSKALGELQVLDHQEEPVRVVFRPAGVHAVDRSVTRWMARIARSPLAVVASPPGPTPQALLGNVASAIAFLATCEAVPPGVVAHPSEGLTTDRLLELLGGRRPGTISRSSAVLLIEALNRSGRLHSSIAGHARRLEMMLLGQEQAESWLTLAGWEPPLGHTAWSELGRAIHVLHSTSP